MRFRDCHLGTSWKTTRHEAVRTSRRLRRHPGRGSASDLPPGLARRTVAAPSRSEKRTSPHANRNTLWGLGRPNPPAFSPMCRGLARSSQIGDFMNLSPDEASTTQPIPHCWAGQPHALPAWLISPPVRGFSTRLDRAASRGGDTPHAISPGEPLMPARPPGSARPSPLCISGWLAAAWRRSL